MDPTTDLEASPPAATAVAKDETSSVRNFFWVVLVLVLVMPMAWWVTFYPLRLVLSWFPVFADLAGLLQVLIPLVVSVAVTIWVAWTGLRRGWASRKVVLGGWSLVILGLGAGVFLGFRSVRQSSHNKVVQSNLRGLQAAAEQFYLENGVIFATYDDLVGPTRYIKALNPIAGEDYRSLGPIRQDHVDELRVKLPDGRTVTLYSPSGVPDGPHVVESGDLRFETTYRHGWPDGPTRVVTKNGQVVSSANYVEGHIVGPCWYLGKDLNAPANRPPDVLGQAKLAAGDPAGAEADFTRALALEQTNLLYEGRGDARLALGNLDGAIADYQAAETAPTRILQNGISPTRRKLEEALGKREALRKAKGDAAGAAADQLTVARLELPALYTQGNARMQARDYAGAVKIYTRIIELAPDGNGHSQRFLPRYELGDIDGALADLNAALRLARSSPELTLMHRAWLLRLKGDLPGAAADFRAVVNARPKDINRRGEASHAACWLYLVECERGQTEAAAAELAEAAARVDRFGLPASVWYRLEVDLLLGRITEEQLMAKVALPAGQQGEADRFHALFFSAMLHQRAGDQPGALDRFQRALKTTYAQQFRPDWLEARRALAAAPPAGKPAP